ncbi:ribonuclease T [Shewanella submarina]|uniref:Ribonuclease T n=1 Tax=Shewanella submarina TaxID=2016376 RepID=A0ABV7GF18_9GAMM|nr:ribonuclease T [Shewanella submarina]MCL1038878.1 ribonuclease T [Shewanella submarina]
MMRRLFTALLLCCSLPVLAAPATGEFIADKACPLYQSKNKKTNPGNQMTAPGQRLEIREYLGQAQAPEWVRVNTSASSSPARWLSTSCGQLKGFTPKGQNAKASKSHSGGSCNAPDQHDSFVLALSWQPAYCAMGGKSKRECRALSLNPLADAHSEFTLHGLWPNKASCGTKYGYCGQVSRKPKSFCDYPRLKMSADVRDALEEVMPSAEYGTCLQRHEFWKHGTCMTDSADEYFAVSVTLINQLNQSEFVQQFIDRNIGSKVTRSAWQQAFDSSFGQGAHRKLKLQCRSGILTEVQVQLPVSLDAPLPQLLKQAANAQRGSCPSTFRIGD